MSGHFLILTDELVQAHVTLRGLVARARDEYYDMPPDHVAVGPEDGMWEERLQKRGDGPIPWRRVEALARLACVTKKVEESVLEKNNVKFSKAKDRTYTRVERRPESYAAGKRDSSHIDLQQRTLS